MSKIKRIEVKIEKGLYKVQYGKRILIVKSLPSIVQMFLKGRAYDIEVVRAGMKNAGIKNSEEIEIIFN